MRIGPRLPEPQKPAAKDYVAIVLAVGFATAVNMITIAFVIVSVLEKVPEGLGENTTQVLITAFSGMIALLGGYIGYKVGYWDGKHWKFEGENDFIPETDEGLDNGPEIPPGT